MMVQSNKTEREEKGMLESIMKRNEPVVIKCPNDKCNGCTGQPVLDQCIWVRLEDADNTVAIVDPGRKIVHIKMGSDSPRTYKGAETHWESVFVGELDLSIWINAVGIFLIGPYLTLFFASQDKGIRYASFPRVKSILEKSLLEQMNSEFLKRYRIENHRRVIFQERLDTTREWVNHRISMALPEVNIITREIISEVVANENNPLGKIMPLILDDHVEEIYSDFPGDNVYFDHSIFGRVQTDVCLNKKETAVLSTFLRAESNLHLDRKSPSLKTELLVYDILLRVSISIPPLSPDGASIEIRRARIRPFTIFDLIKNGTLTYEAAAVLIFSINSRFNITITGEPGTGKTTLMNALDFTTPNHWRKIYIEDALESRVVKNQHQIRFKVDPIEEKTRSIDKSIEIIKCLHRSPDYLILGEIQTADHSQALFQSISAGLRSIQTCHSGSPLSLITRWVDEHNISLASLALMDIIVSMKRPTPGDSRRYVNEIAEVCKKVDSGLMRYNGLNTIYTAVTPDGLGKPCENGVFVSSRFLEIIEKIVVKLKAVSEKDRYDQISLSKIVESVNM